jgi:hypothetical protein
MGSSIMRRYHPVNTLPKNPPRSVSYGNQIHPPIIPYNHRRQLPHPQRPFLNDADIDRIQIILYVIGFFLAVFSSQVGGEIISFSTALLIVFFLAGGISLFLLWNIKRYVGLLAWGCSALIAWFLIIQPNLG